MGRIAGPRAIRDFAIRNYANEKLSPWQNHIERVVVNILGKRIKEIARSVQRDYWLPSSWTEIRPLLAMYFVSMVRLMGPLSMCDRDVKIATLRRRLVRSDSSETPS